MDLWGYLTQAVQPTVALREEARQAAEIALTLQPNLGEAIFAKGDDHFAWLQDYYTAGRYFEQTRQLLPNSSRIPELLAYLVLRRGQRDRSESDSTKPSSSICATSGLLTHMRSPLSVFVVFPSSAKA